MVYLNTVKMIQVFSFYLVNNFQVLFFGVLVFYFVLLIVDIFIFIYKIIIYWYWNLYLGVLKNCLWDVSKIGHTDSLPLQDCRRLWWGFQLGFQTCLLQFIYLRDLKYPSSYLFKTYFVGCLLVCIIFIGLAFVDPETCLQLY